MFYCFSGFAIRNCGQKSSCGLRKKAFVIKTCGMNNLEIEFSLCSALMKSFVVDRAESTN